MLVRLTPSEHRKTAFNWDSCALALTFVRVRAHEYLKYINYIFSSCSIRQLVSAGWAGEPHTDEKQKKKFHNSQTIKTDDEQQWKK